MTEPRTESAQAAPGQRAAISIRTSAVLFILATAIVFCGLLGLTSYTYRFAMDQRQQVSDLHVTQVRAAEDLRYLHLKYQHTWKDLLLRGHDPQDYHRQLGDFYELERRIRAAIESLESETGPDSPALSALKHFKQEFFQAGQVYRRALRTYNDEDISDPQFAADAITQHAGSDPERRITELLGSLQTSRHTSYDRITHEMRQFEVTIALIVLLLICIFLLAVFYMSNRYIIAPINKGIVLAEAISSGEMENRFEIEHASTEISKLLHALRRMQANINNARQELISAKEHAEQSNKTKSAFLSRMSHELRTPLHAILGFGQLLQMQTDTLTDRQRNNVDKIIAAGQQLLNLINEVLDLARIDNETLELSIETVALSEIIADCINDTRPLAQQKSASIVNRVPDEADHRVRADSLRLKQALRHLLNNAIKHGLPGAMVTVSCLETDACSLRIEVTDNGPGIPFDRQHLLFMPFEQIDEKQFVEGTGIGLALTRKLVESMQGKVGVESRPGEGSTFWIQLPLAGAGSMQDRTAASGERPSKNCSTGSR